MNRFTYFIRTNDYVRKTIIILLFLFTLITVYHGSLKIIKDIFDWDTAEFISFLYTGLIFVVLYWGYKYFKFSCKKYPDIMICLEYYFGILDIIREKLDNAEDRDDYPIIISDAVDLIEDYIIFYSNEKHKGLPIHFFAKELLSRVRSINKNAYTFIWE